jgi:F-type H+-transporting ATPase subunit a
VAAEHGAQGGGGMPDPIHQFEVKRLIPLEFFGVDATFTNSARFMVAGVLLSFGLLMYASRGRSLVPSRLQSVAESIYEFVAGMVRDSMGEQGMKFFPLIFTFFLFILTLNMLGMVPGFFTVTSQLWVTAALAVFVFLTVIVIGFAKNGLGFLKLFVPDGVPIYVLPLVSMIEVISFFSRPLSHSLRLFANMLAGHITLKVFAGFIIMLLGAGGAASAIAPLPLLAVLGITALEFLVAFLQAYVFTMLTCMYLNDALHPGH